MNHSLVLLALISTFGLVACDREPVVVNTPPAAVVVPGPAGPAGETGKTGGTTRVIVVPPPPAPTN